MKRGMVSPGARSTPPLRTADEERLRLICAELSLGQVRTRLLQECVAAIIVAAALATAVPLGRVLAWVATMGVVVVLTAALDHAWHRATPTARNAHRFLRGARATSMLTGAAWGSVLAYALPPESAPAPLAIVLIGLAAVFIGSAFAHAATPRLFWASAVPQWSFTILAMVSAQIPLLPALVIPGTAFIALVGFYNHRLHTWTVDMVRLRVHNERLVTELRIEQEQTQDAWSRVMEQNRSLNEAQGRLVELASTDDLTGVLNRRAFLEAVGNASTIARSGGAPYCLGILDVDHFKTINDRFGHAVGDETLRVVADALKGSLRTGDVVGRIGGEEFGLLLRSPDLVDGAAIAERLRQSCLDARIPGCPELRVTASIGLVPSGNESDPARLLRLADRAMYTAKDRGRNRVAVVDSTYADGMVSLPS